MSRIPKPHLTPPQRGSFKEAWDLGYPGYPHQARPEVQDEAAARLQSLYGWGQWPGCAWWLGLY